MHANVIDRDWQSAAADPTTLIALWPSADAPTATEILALLSSSGARVLDETIEPADDALWAALVSCPALACPVAVWAEPAQALSPGEVGDASAEQCRWVIGLQTMLERDEPVESFAALLKGAAAGLAEARALLDVAAHRWYPRAQLDALARNHANVVPAELLWTTHIVAGGMSKAGDRSDDDAPVWLHTHGLARCGRPELEIVEVPAKHLRGAARLLQEVAEMIIDSPHPQAGDIMPIGRHAAVAIVPWQDVAPHVNRDAPGSIDDRVRGDEDDPEHAGWRAVICDPEPRGTFRKIWTWPSQAIHSLEGEDAVIWRLSKTSARQAMLARSTWSELVMAHASASRTSEKSPQGVQVIVKAGFEVDGEPEGDSQRCEHIWLEVIEFSGDRARGTLLNTPLNIASMQQGDTLWIEREQVTDWQMLTQSGPWTPVDALLRPDGLAARIAGERR